MKKQASFFVFLTLVLFSLYGCDANNKTSDINFCLLYGITVFLALLVLAFYFVFVKKKNPFFVLLFSSMLVANIGYFLLSFAPTLSFALHANRLAYLGSACLPFAMLMIILDLSRLKYKKSLPIALSIVTVLVLLIALSQGILDIYYKEVSFEIINGSPCLNKIYGSWHIVYAFYILIYFIAMIVTTVIAFAKKKLTHKMQSIFLVAAVSLNIVVWFFEQFVHIRFEFLSLSYVISGLFILALVLMIQESDAQKPVIITSTPVNTAVEAEPTPIVITPRVTDSQKELFNAGLLELTKTERIIYNFYIKGSSTKDIMSELNITENTLKYHNKNIYSKLGVSSRKQLIEIAEAITKD